MSSCCCGVLVCVLALPSEAIMNNAPAQGRAGAGSEWNHESIEMSASRRVAAAAATWSDTSANSSANSGPPFADVVTHALLHSCVADDALPPITTALHGDISANISARILRMYPKTVDRSSSIRQANSATTPAMRWRTRRSPPPAVACCAPFPHRDRIWRCRRQRNRRDLAEIGEQLQGD